MNEHNTQTPLSYFVPIIGLDEDTFYLKKLSVKPGVQFEPQKFVQDRNKGATQEFTKISRDDFDGLLALLLQNRLQSGSGGGVGDSCATAAAGNGGGGGNGTATVKSTIVFVYKKDSCVKIVRRITGAFDKLVVTRLFQRIRIGEHSDTWHNCKNQRAFSHKAHLEVLRASHHQAQLRRGREFRHRVKLKIL